MQLGRSQPQNSLAVVIPPHRWTRYPERLVGGDIMAAAQEERFTRVKHDASFPHRAIAACLEGGGMGLDDVDCVVFYEKHFLEFERLKRSCFGKILLWRRAKG
jgi:hypothetical protein